MEHKLAAILAADAPGYSRLMGADEEGTLRMLTPYREVTDAFIQQHHGRIVGTAGDSVLAEFASAVDAVQCAVAIQQTRNSPVCLEVLPLSVEKETGSEMLSGENSLFQLNSSNKAFASCKSLVSNPSVNQP
jgi:hypothetical protein